MRRGCIAVGKVQCDGCGRLLEYGDRYLVMDNDEETKQCFCVDCCLSRGYASYKIEKGEKTITFLSQG